jgi:hypothetical protein
VGAAVPVEVVAVLEAEAAEVEEAPAAAVQASERAWMGFKAAGKCRNGTSSARGPENLARESS